MQPKQTLRGYVILDGDSYFSICLELNIYARGDTPDVAIENCVSAVNQYVREAMNEDHEYCEELLSRRAPAYFWVQYRWISLKHNLRHWLRGSDNDRSSKGGNPFETQFPAHVGC